MNKQFLSYFFAISIFLNLPLSAEEQHNLEGAAALTSVACLISNVIKQKAGQQGYKFFLKKSQNFNNEPNLKALIAGHVCSLITAYSFLIASQILQAKLNKKTFKKGLKNGLKKPLTIYSEVVDSISKTVSSKQDKTNASFKDAFFNFFDFAKSNNMWDDFIAITTPFYQNTAGERLWKQYGLKKDMIVTSLEKKTAIVCAPAVLAIITGLAKGVNERYKTQIK